MKKSGILLIGFILPFSLLAQEVIEIDKEDLVIAEEKGISAKALSSAEPRVLILNSQNQKVGQRAIHDQNTANMLHQPVVRVMGTPISTTYAVELKKSRQEAELQTEQKIVEKLESSRLRDEQERLNKLFKDKSTSVSVAAVTQPKATIVVADNKVVDSSEIYTEVVTPFREKSTDRIYVSIQGGQSSNLTKAIENVQSYGSFGISLGSYDDSGLILESSFLYSRHEINKRYKNLYRNNEHNYGEPNVTDVHQLTGVISLSYTPSSSRFRPYIGPAIAYNYWIYSANVDSVSTCTGINFQYCDNQVKADSIDLGLNIGMDFNLSPKASIGFNMLVNVLNLYNNRSQRTEHQHYHNNDYYNYTYEYNNKKYYNPLKQEETNWIIASINAKLYF